MADLPNVPRYVRSVAESGLDEARDQAIAKAKEEALVIARHEVPDSVVSDEVLRAMLDHKIERQLHQDRLLGSKRTWSAVSSAIAVVLLLPEVQALLQHWLTPQLGEAAPLVLAALSATLATWSKRSDTRPVREKTKT
jgi:hypothetical protein